MSNKKELGKILEKSRNTAAFLQDVIAAIERLYAESDGADCPRGFAALDQAVQAFQDAEP